MTTSVSLSQMDPLLGFAMVLNPTSTHTKSHIYNGYLRLMFRNTVFPPRGCVWMLRIAIDFNIWAEWIFISMGFCADYEIGGCKPGNGASFNRCKHSLSLSS